MSKLRYINTHIKATDADINEIEQFFSYTSIICCACDIFTPIIPYKEFGYFLEVSIWNNTLIISVSSKKSWCGATNMFLTMSDSEILHYIGRMCNVIYDTVINQRDLYGMYTKYDATFIKSVADMFSNYPTETETALTQLKATIKETKSTYTAEEVLAIIDKVAEIKDEIAIEVI